MQSYDVFIFAAPVAQKKVVNLGFKRNTRPMTHLGTDVPKLGTNMHLFEINYQITPRNKCSSEGITNEPTGAEKILSTLGLRFFYRPERSIGHFFGNALIARDNLVISRGYK